MVYANPIPLVEIEFEVNNQRVDVKIYNRSTRLIQCRGKIIAISGRAPNLNALVGEKPLENGVNITPGNFYGAFFQATNNNFWVGARQNIICSF